MPNVGSGLALDAYYSAGGGALGGWSMIPRGAAWEANAFGHGDAARLALAPRSR